MVRVLMLDRRMVEVKNATFLAASWTPVPPRLGAFHAAGGRWDLLDFTSLP